MFLFSGIPSLVQGAVVQTADDGEIRYLLTDSRKIIPSPKALFFAISGMRHNGHDYIDAVYQQGICYFVVEQDVDFVKYPKAGFIRVDSTIKALQAIAIVHRRKFTYPVIGITGSNGKTIVKEWLYQMLSSQYRCVKSPGSYNSQIGVPLSVWEMGDQHELGIFEAGISQPGEMENLEKIIMPSIGIFTNLGPAHDEGFKTAEEKVREKARLFKHAQVVIYNSDCREIDQALKWIGRDGKQFIGWGHKAGSKVVLKFKNNHEAVLSGHFGNITLNLPFEDRASQENVLHCVMVLLWLGFDAERIQEKINQLHAVPMRLELKPGIHQCQLVDDSYNNDLEGLRISLDFLNGLNQQKKTVILSDILQSGISPEVLCQQVALIITERRIHKFIGVGEIFHRHKKIFDSLPLHTALYESTVGFLKAADWNDFVNEAILVKGARVFQFEKIVQRLQKKIHGTVMAIDLAAMVHNLNFFKSLLRPQVKLMVMVKAFAYGSGSAQIAGLMQYHGVDYLGVAYADEGVELRENHIRLPILVMNPSEESFEALLAYNLEPEIYSLSLLNAYIRFLEGRPGKIHLKLDTGMHRLGLETQDIGLAITALKQHPEIELASVFSHLAASDEEKHDSFSREQSSCFLAMAGQLKSELGISPLLHLINSAGILRFPDLQFDMVRLGIGLYGIDPSANFQEKLRPTTTLKTVISQIKMVSHRESVGYGRAGIKETDRRIATLAIGYADGYDRGFGNGVGEVLIHSKRAPVVGNVCMDMTMVDITDIPEAKEGDEAIIFGQQLPIQEMAAKIHTIPYELLTNTSERVKRVFFAEGI